MINYIKFKKPWHLALILAFFCGYCCNGQSLLEVTDGTEKENGVPFDIKLKYTSVPLGCSSQKLTLNIGKLAYLSSGILPDGAKVTAEVSNGETEVTISNIVNGNEGDSRTITLKAQFLPGTCNGERQEIRASLAFVGCSAAPIYAAPVTVISNSPNSVNVAWSNQTDGNEPYCLKKIIKYRLEANNNGNKGFSVTNARFIVEMDKCAELIGVYKDGTYESVGPSITSGSDMQTIAFNIPDLVLSSNFVTPQWYNLYVRYPCHDGINDCITGVKTINAYVMGNSCGSGISTASKSVKTNISASTALCGDLSCSSGTGSPSDVPSVSASFSMPCPNACNPSIAANFNLLMPPLNLSYANQQTVIDIPEGLIVSGAYAGSSACGTSFTVKYINAAGEKFSSPASGSPIKKVEFSASCPLTKPVTNFFIYFKYNSEKTPVSNDQLHFAYKFTSDGQAVVSGSHAAAVGKCEPRMNIWNDVKKASDLNYAGNYNASGVPGEVFTYKLFISNPGSSSDISTLVTNALDERLEYAGGFKYAFGNLLYTSLLDNSSFTIPDLGTVRVTVPPVGKSGTISLSGFNFPCINKYLYIEFNVRVKAYVTAGTKIPNVSIVKGSPYGANSSNISIDSYTHVKSKMFVKCAFADEWNENGINVKNNEEVRFKMQVTNAGSNPVMLSELINLKPHPDDQFEVGSNARGSSFNINYSAELPVISSSLAKIPAADFKYAQNSGSMDRDMLCPPQYFGNMPNWSSAWSLNANWLKVAFPGNVTLNPGDFIEVIYKGMVSGNIGAANNSFAFKVVDNLGNCNLFSDNSNMLAITNDGIGIGCSSCALANPNSIEVKKLFEGLLKNIITRLVKGESDSQISGSRPKELLILKPYIADGGGDKIYHFASTRNVQNKITGIRFSFSSESENDVVFVEENGLIYDPEVGAVDSSYYKVDTSLFASSDQYFSSCREQTGSCKSRTDVRKVDFCPDSFCLPAYGEIKIMP